MSSKSNLSIIYPNLTGNPFVDAGAWSLAGLLDKESPNDLEISDLKVGKKEILDLYATDAWSKVLYSVFPNNPITNPSIKESRGRMEEFLDSLIEEIEPLEDNGSCIGCGRRDFEDRSTKTQVPLTGSGKFLNYFSYATEGADYCPGCAFAIQFSPLAMYSCGNLLFLHSNSERVMKSWVKEPIKEVRRQILTNSFDGCYSSEVKNPVNALFKIVGKIQEYREVRWDQVNPTINFYHFTNWMQGPELNMYALPTSVFRFLAKVQRHPNYDAWRKIVYNGYIARNKDEKDEEELKNNKNQVYLNLLNNRRITGYFFNRKNQQCLGTWSLLSLYLEEVRNMDKERIEAIKEVGDRIANHIKTTNDINRLGKLERAEKYGDFRNQLRIIIKNRINSGEEGELFTLDEYINSLVPDYRYWRETQDLLLFRIYEQLHEWLAEQEKQEMSDEDIPELEVK